MIITCENCSTSFNLDDKFLKPSGSKVRCSKCKHIFTAFPATALEEKEAPPAETPVDEPESAAEEAAVPGMAPEADAAVEEDVQEEAVVDEDILPGWGKLDKRGPMWEAACGGTYLQAGADILIMAHPEAIKSVQAIIKQMD